MPRKKNVYVVMSGERREGGRVLGVYASLRRARTKLHEEAEKLRRDKDLRPSHLMWADDVNSFAYTIDWWAIRKYPLQ